MTGRRDIPKIIKILKEEVGPGWPHSREPFRVLISTVLSQRTRDENTAMASKRLFSKFKTPKQLANAKLRDIQGLIKPSGFYKVKAGYIKQIAKEIVDRFDGKVPDNIDELLLLPGVGRKTANCVLVYAYMIPAIPVDTHVHRISNRLGLVKTKTPEQTEMALTGIVPRKYWIQLNELMVRYGQKICLPIRPRCERCRLKDMCAYYELKST